jgi:hypothetical protein
MLKKIEEEVETGINMGNFARMRQQFKTKPCTNGKGSSTEEKMEARQLTGGYLQYLRKNMEELTMNIEADDEVGTKCDQLARFVAYFRARPSTLQSEEESRELSPRLMRQLLKLAYCLAAVSGKKEIDAEVMKDVKQTALDTAEGRTFKIARCLYKAGSKGLDVGSISASLLEGDVETKALLKFLRKIEVVQSYTKSDIKIGIGTRLAWRLTEKVNRLYQQVMEG